MVEQLPHCDLLRLSPLDWLICSCALASCHRDPRANPLNSPSAASEREGRKSATLPRVERDSEREQLLRAPRALRGPGEARGARGVADRWAFRASVGGFPFFTPPIFSPRQLRPGEGDREAKRRERETLHLERALLVCPFFPSPFFTTRFPKCKTRPPTSSLCVATRRTHSWAKKSSNLALFMLLPSARIGVDKICNCQECLRGSLSIGVI